MDASAFRALHPKEYVARFLSESVRPDGRTFTAVRRLTAAVGTIDTANGSALVRLGKTAVVAGVVALVTFPSQAAPTHGMLEVTVHLSALCGRQYHAHRPSEDAQAMSQFLHRTIAR